MYAGNSFYPQQTQPSHATACRKSASDKELSAYCSKLQERACLRMCKARTDAQLNVDVTVVLSCLLLLLLALLQLPTQGAVTTLIAAPQGVLRNFYPMKGEGRNVPSSTDIKLLQ
jgi:hypothetical protein